jgi:hypothetical protein
MVIKSNAVQLGWHFDQDSTISNSGVSIAMKIEQEMKEIQKKNIL